jgi:TonB family protein
MNFLEQLEKDRYGSFELKKQVGPNLIKGLVVSLLLHCTIFASPYVIRLWNGPQPDKPKEKVYGGAPTLVPWERQRAVSDKPFIPLPKRANPVNPRYVPGNPDDQDTLIMVINTPTGTGSGRRGDDTMSGGGGGFDTAVFVANVPPEEFFPPDSIWIPREIEPVALDINPQPIYPKLAVTAGITGKVVVKVFVDQNGDVKTWKVIVANPQGVGFDDEVAKVITRWKFTPAVQAGHPVGVWVSVPFKFTLK